MSKTKNKKDLSPKEKEELLGILTARFEKNKNRHKGIDWTKIQTRLEANSDKLLILFEMEKTGGEPDVVGFDKKTSEYIFFDCSQESPKERRSICYDREALDSKIVRLKWHQKWVLKFYPKKNIESCKNLESSI